LAQGTKLQIESGIPNAQKCYPIEKPNPVSKSISKLMRDTSAHILSYIHDAGL
jgi:hypothetical protein